MDKTKRYIPQNIKVKEVDRDAYTIRFIMSTPDVDRHGEIVDQKGWDFNNYLQNPVVLWGHDQSIPAVGKIIQLEIVNGNTEGVVQFAYNENPLAKTLFDLYAGEYMRAVSVGFMNRKWAYDEGNDVLTLLENELYELSLVNVPANARALAKSKGIDISPLEAIESIEKRASIEKAKAMGSKDAEEEKEEEVPADPAQPTPTEDPAKPEGTETKPEETTAPEKTEETEATDDEVKGALETLCRANPTAIKESVRALTDHLKDADTNAKVETTPASQGRTGKRKLSTHDINRVIRNLIKSSS